MVCFDGFALKEDSIAYDYAAAAMQVGFSDLVELKYAVAAWLVHPAAAAICVVLVARFSKLHGVCFAAAAVHVR
jgi:hypothetical protein